jgi:hypothetical protein
VDLPTKHLSAAIRRASSFRAPIVLAGAIGALLLVAASAPPTVADKTVVTALSRRNVGAGATIQTESEEGNDHVTFFASCTVPWVANVFLEQGSLNPDGTTVTWERTSATPTWTQCGPYPTPGLSVTRNVGGGVLWRPVVDSIPTSTPTATPTGTPPTATPTPTGTPPTATPTPTAPLIQVGASLSGRHQLVITTAQP